MGPGKTRRLQNACMFTMGDVAQRSVYDEEWFYKTFGIDGEILIDHAWGIEPVTMADIKGYHTRSHSLSNGQVLPRPYRYGEARTVFTEMIDRLCCDMYTKNIVARTFTWWVSYDWKSLEVCPDYEGPVLLDFYGRLHPKHSGGTARLREKTHSFDLISSALLKQFDLRTDPRLLFRRLGVNAADIAEDDGVFQLDLFTDYSALDREKKIRGAMLEIRKKYGTNAVFKGLNIKEGATALERNQQIGGHKADL